MHPSIITRVNHTASIFTEGKSFNIQTPMSDYLDSLDCVEFCMDLEEEFDIELTDEEFDECNTVSDIYKLIQEKIPCDNT